MDLFKHKPLDLEGHSFRLLRLCKAGVGNVRCEVIHAHLDDESILEYEALSYTWGGLHKGREIEIDESMMTVTHNLWLALQSLRRIDQDRILWIDAICIDQNNEKERGHQVRQMGSIYAKAEQVLIWLGPATPETDILLDDMSRFDKQSAQHACRDWKVTDERWQKLSCLEDLTDSGGMIRMMPARQETLRRLLDQPWFERVWIIQEVANARAARVVCGTKSVLARTFALFPHLLGVPRSLHCQAVLDVMPGPTRKHSWWTENHDLGTLLLRLRHSQASDPRDKVYALLGISSDRFAAGFPGPDYEKSDFEIIQDVACFLFQVPKEIVGYPYPSVWTLVDFLDQLEDLAEVACFLAAENGSAAIVRFLLNAWNVHPGFFNDKKKQSLLLRAAEKGRKEVVVMLLNEGRVDINAQDRLGQTPLLLAAKNGHQSIVRHLLNTGAADTELISRHGWTPLWAAAIEGHSAIVNMLLKLKEENASHSGSQAVLNGLDDEEQLVSGLLKAQKVECKHRDDRYQQDPLSWTVGRGCIALFKLFLKVAAVNRIGTNGLSETLLTQWVNHKPLEPVLTLIPDTIETDFGRDDSWAGDILLWAVENGNRTIVQLVIATGIAHRLLGGSNGRELFNIAVKGDHQAVVDLLIDSSSFPNHGLREALWQAVNNSNLPMLKRLLERCKVDRGYTLGYEGEGTLMGWSAYSGNTAVVKMLLDTPGIEVDSKDASGRTPLSVAASAGSVEIVKLLLDTNRVDVNTRDNAGVSPIHLATQNRFDDVVELLKEHGADQWLNTLSAEDLPLLHRRDSAGPWE